MEAQAVTVARSAKQDAETILAVFHAHKDRPGVVIEHTELFVRLGITGKDKFYAAAVNIAKQRFFEQAGIRIQSVWRRGYMIPEGDAALAFAARKLTRGERLVVSASQDFASIPDSRLSERGRDARTKIVGTVNYLVELFRNKRIVCEQNIPRPEPRPRMLPAE